MIVIGLIGGIASGKSFVAALLASRGAALIDADRIGHRVLELPVVKTALREVWGEAIFDSHGQVTRSNLAAKVFSEGDGSGEPLRRLESITHPHIKRLIRKEIERLHQAGTSVAVLDAPVLIKAGWNELCDKIIFVDANTEIRQQRVLDRGWDVEQWKKREGAQTPLSAKRRLADVIIKNSGIEQETERQIDQIWNAWNLSDTSLRR